MNMDFVIDAVQTAVQGALATDSEIARQCIAMLRAFADFAEALEDDDRERAGAAFERLVAIAGGVATRSLGEEEAEALTAGWGLTDPAEA